jgi:unsaturated rhamnogalacturonyl hydrolase
MRRTCRLWCTAVVLAGLGTGCWDALAVAQQPASVETVAVAGDQPADPGPLAKDLSGEVRSKAIRAVIRKVAEWELSRAAAQPMSRTWDWGTLDLGLVAASHTLGDGSLNDYVLSVGEHFGWKIEHTLTPANDYALAQALIDATRGNQKLLSAIRLRLDGDLSDPFDPEHPVWTRTDALFFEAPAAVELSEITGDPTYNAFVNREWHRTEKLLYDPQKHLFVSSTLAQDEGKNSARANGMAMTALARIIASLPSDDPLRPIYIQRLREMAAAVAAAQQKDGLWRPVLLDAASYSQPDTAGSSFIVYALAWGITHHHLNAQTYLPVVEHAWAGLVGHIYQDGRLGAIPPVNDELAAYNAGSSWNYGVGAFLLAAGEVDALSQHKHW